MYKFYTLEEIMELALQGNPEFQHRLARHHRLKTKNYDEARKWLELAADQGYAPALIDLGDIYLSDKYGIRDLDKAEQYFVRASELGGTDAMNKIGSSYYHYGNYNEAIKWFKLANNYTRIGDCYFNGRGVDQNYEEAFKCYIAAKDNNKIARSYFYGYGVEQNYEEAFKYYLAADDKDMLGECYLNGWGVERNIEKTIELWESASKEHIRYYDIMFKLGHLYGDGIKMEPNYEKALYWWDELAHNDSGDFAEEGAFAEAIYQIACYFYDGKGVKKNLKSALKYFKSTIDVFYDKDPDVYFMEYDSAHPRIDVHQYKKDEKCFVSQEPDFIIHARKVLIKHGHKSIINKTKKAAQNGDAKAAEILREFEIDFDIPKPTPTVTVEVKKIPIAPEKPKREPPIDIAVGDKVLHKIFGEGCVCESDDGYICVEFASVGQKKFLNPEAFNKGFLRIKELT